MLTTFPSADAEFVKIDFVTESGTAYQPRPLVAGAATRLALLAGGTLSAADVADFMDYRGIVVDYSVDTMICSTSFYLLPKYIPDLLGILPDLLLSPAFPEEEVEVYRRQQHHRILAQLGKPREVARRLFYRSLFGTDHPLGAYADAADALLLDRQVIAEYYDATHAPADFDLVVSGKFDDKLLSALTSRFGETIGTSSRPHLILSDPHHDPAVVVEHILGVEQTSLRIGRVLPLRWYDADYAFFVLLTTALGGYFESRLMSNLREERGLTYGIAAHTQMFRGVLLFWVVADVDSQRWQEAEEAIFDEMDKLRAEPMPDDELTVVKRVLEGDMARAVDGFVERSQRYLYMSGADVDERHTDMLREAIKNATALDLQRVAASLLDRNAMTVCRAGALG